MTSPLTAWATTARKRGRTGPGGRRELVELTQRLNGMVYRKVVRRRVSMSHLLRQRGFPEITRRTPALAVALLRSTLCGLACCGLHSATLQLDRLGGHRLDSLCREIHEQDFS